MVVPSTSKNVQLSCVRAMDYLLFVACTRRGLQMSEIAVSVWISSVALLMPPLLVVGWVTWWPPAAHSTPSPSARSSGSERTPTSISPAPLRAARVGAPLPNQAKTRDVGDERRPPRPVTAERVAVDRANALEKDDAALRLAVRRDELYFAGRLERFYDNRERYDERVSLAPDRSLAAIPPRTTQ